MTFKELKKLVKLPLYKEQRVPTVKALEESGVSVVAEKILPKWLCDLQGA